MKIAILGMVHPKGIEFLKDNEFEVFEVENFEIQSLKESLKSVDGILLRTSKLDKDILQHCDNLKIISRHGVGYDNVDLDFLNNNKIALGITSTSNAASVSEHVMSFFIYLTKNNYFNGTQFYRVVNDFVIQAGNSDNIKTSLKRQKIGKYLLPNDFNKGHTHKRGMVSMPSSSIDNPYKMASPYEFFIVQKKDGAHHLDGNYTIFGTVTNGMQIVDIIANLPTDDRDWPLNNVYINKIEIIN